MDASELVVIQHRWIIGIGRGRSGASGGDPFLRTRGSLEPQTCCETSRWTGRLTATDLLEASKFVAACLFVVCLVNPLQLALDLCSETCRRVLREDRTWCNV